MIGPRARSASRMRPTPAIRAGVASDDPPNLMTFTVEEIIGRSEPEQPVDLDDEGAVLQAARHCRQGRRGRSRQRLVRRVALVSVDDEQLAAGPVLPSESQVAAERAVRGTVL